MDKRSERILKIYMKHNGYSLHDLGIKLDESPIELSSTVLYLREQGYLIARDVDPESVISATTRLCITEKGRITLEEHTESSKLKKYNEIRAWITLAIALAAFIKSFFF